MDGIKLGDKVGDMVGSIVCNVNFVTARSVHIKPCLPLPVTNMTDLIIWKLHKSITTFSVCTMQEPPLRFILVPIPDRSIELSIILPLTPEMYTESSGSKLHK